MGGDALSTVVRLPEAVRAHSKIASRRQPEKRELALSIARQRFGYDDLRAGQKEALEAVLAGRDTLAVMPTGSGKSAIYQIPAVALPGPTVVISPLIALQKDQMDSLQTLAVGGAAVVNSATPQSVRKQVFRDFEGGDLEFLFLTPEQLVRDEILELLQEAEPSLFVIDEAHCISEWGHDFRPDYLSIGKTIEALGHPQTVALTATAGPEIREEIISRLFLRDPAVIVHGFDRPNIHLAVREFQTEEEKFGNLVRRAAWAEKPGIVYVSSRKHTQTLAAALIDAGVSAVGYHGGLRAKNRTPLQDAFMSGETEVIVATSAFGMGVDKPNVRFVYHYDAPHSLDAYYQEIGRAGRDGKPSEAVLFYRPEDLRIHKFFAGGSRIDQRKVERFVQTLKATDHPLTAGEIKENTGLAKAKVARLTEWLSAAGALVCGEGGVRISDGKVDELEAIVRQVTDEELRVHKAELARIERMRMYAELATCRRAYLLRYFGEQTTEECGSCDACEKGSAGAAEMAVASSQASGQGTRREVI